MPFRAQEISDPKGIYYGINPISRNPILCGKANLLNPSAWRLGVPGSGKSMGMKDEIYRIALGIEDDILVCDPEGEYSPLIQALGLGRSGHSGCAGQRPPYQYHGHDGRLRAGGRRPHHRQVSVCPVPV